MVKLIFLMCFVLPCFMSCNFKNSQGFNNQKAIIRDTIFENDTKKGIKTVVDTTMCKDRLKEMIMSCGSGCALNLKEIKFELQERNTYKIIFSQQIFINEQKVDESMIEYYFFCRGKIIERVYNDEIINYLDEDKSTPTQKLSFTKYGTNFCSCIN